jgi:hypothetical protein
VRVVSASASLGIHGVEEPLTLLERAMFSQHERRQLDEIEQWFREWDPELARKLTHESPATPTGSERTPTGIIVFLYAIGGLFLMLGVVTGNIVVIICGVAATAGAVLTPRQHRQER